MQFDSGMVADRLTMARRRKSRASNPSGSCVEIAELPGWKVAVCNSRDKSGPALVYPRAELGRQRPSVRCCGVQVNPSRSEANPSTGMVSAAAIQYQLVRAFAAAAG